jgi:hypothetical protein
MPTPKPLLVTVRFLGHVTTSTPSEIDGGKAALVQNLYLKDRRQKLVRRGGTTPVGAALSPTQSLDMIHWVFSGSTEYLLASHNGNLVNLVGAGVVNGTGRLVSGRKADAVTIQNVTYVADGESVLLAFQNGRAYTAMCEQPPAPTLTVGASGVLGGTFYYKETYLNWQGNESEPSPASSGIVVSGNQIVVTLGISSDPDCTGRRLYRSRTNQTGSFQLVVSINDNTTPTFVDNVPTDSLGVFMREGDQTRTPPGKFPVNWQNRLVCASGNLILISNVREPWITPVLPDLISAIEERNPNQGTRIPIQDEALGHVTALVVHGSVLLAFTRSTLYQVRGISPLTFQSHLLAHVGCVSHRTAVSHKNEVIWLSPQGVYSLVEGGGLSRISEDIRETLEGVSAAILADAHAFVWDEKYVLCLAGSGFVFDLVEREWTINTPWEWNDSTVSVFTGGQTERIYAARTGEARGYRLETGATDDGTPIPVKWKSKDSDFGAPSMEKRLQYCNALFKQGDGTAVIRTYRDGNVIGEWTHDLSRGAGPQAAHTRFVGKVCSGGRGEFFTVEIEYNGMAEVFELLQVEVLGNVIGSVVRRRC